MKNRCYQIIFLLSLLLIISYGCQIHLGSSPKPEETIVVSEDAAENLEIVIQSAVTSAEQTGTLAFSITEEQITSFVALRLQEEIPVKFINPQIYFRDHTIQLYGQIEQQFVVSNIFIELIPTPNETGEVNIEISEADLGVIPVSSTTTEDIEGLINESLNDITLTQVGGKILVQSIDISDGLLTLSGVLSQ